MLRAPLLRRVLVVLFACLQALGPAAASVADARLLSASRAPAGMSHVEDHGSSACPRVHPVDCALCQYVSAGFFPGAAAADVLVPGRAVALPHGPAEHRRAAAALRQPPSRAPPPALTA